MEQLLTQGRVVRGWIGITRITDLNEETRPTLGVRGQQGVVVMELLRGSPADRAGVQPGDVVVEVDGRDVENAAQLRNELAAAEVGTDLRLTLLRQGRKLEVDGARGGAARRMPRKELGEILREADLISEAQLAEALTLQRTFGERLASILVRQKILTEKFAVTYLGRQLGVPAVDLSKAEIDLSLLDVVHLDVCERHLVFPVEGGGHPAAARDVGSARPRAGDGDRVQERACGWPP